MDEFGATHLPHAAREALISNPPARAYFEGLPKGHQKRVVGRVLEVYVSRYGDDIGRDAGQTALAELFRSRTVLTGAPPFATPASPEWNDEVAEALIRFCTGRMKNAAAAKAFRGAGVHIPRTKRSLFVQTNSASSEALRPMFNRPDRWTDPAHPAARSKEHLVLLRLDQNPEFEIPDDREAEKQLSAEEGMAFEDLWIRLDKAIRQRLADSPRQLKFHDAICSLAARDGGPLAKHRSEQPGDARLFRGGGATDDGTQFNNQFILQHLRERFPDENWDIATVRKFLRIYKSESMNWRGEAKTLGLTGTADDSSKVSTPIDESSEFNSNARLGEKS